MDAPSRGERALSHAGPIPSWSPEDGIRRVLVVTAHPDDVDFGSAGTVAAFTSAGVEVTYCIVTDGDAGGSDRSMSRGDMAALRRDEQRAAAAAVGVTDVRFLGHPDGLVEASRALRRDISRVIRQVRPERVLTQSPERNWDAIFASHPDHLATGEAAVCAVYPDARNPFAHPELLDEGLEPWSVSELWIMSPHGGGSLRASRWRRRRPWSARSPPSCATRARWPTRTPWRGAVLAWSREQAGVAGLADDASAELFRVTRIP